MTDAAAPGMRAVMRQRSLRAANLALVLETIVASDRPSRADIAASTGMTRSSVSRLVDELVAGGLVREQAPISGGRGRPATPLVPARRSVAALGCEIGVNRVVVRAIDLTGEVLVHQDQPLDDRDPVVAHAQAAAMLDRARRLVDGVRLVGLGLAVPGLVAEATGEILRAPNLDWQGVRPQPLLADSGLDLGRFVLVNEADAAATTVAHTAPGRRGDRDEFLYVSGDTGIGSAVVLRGRIAAGGHGWGGELGHLCLDPNGPRCACGATGCLETRAGRGAVLAAAGVRDTDALLAKLAAGDPVAGEAVRAAGRALGVAISGALNLLDVTEVVLGGFLACLGDHVVAPIVSELRARVLSAPIAPATVSIEDGGEWRAATGAAHRVLAGVIADPAGWLDGDHRDGDHRDGVQERTGQ